MEVYDVKHLKEKYKIKIGKNPTGRDASNKEWLINKLKTEYKKSSSIFVSPPSYLTLLPTCKDSNIEL